MRAYEIKWQETCLSTNDRATFVRVVKELIAQAESVDEHKVVVKTPMHDGPNHISAIKHVRDCTGAGLAEAKAFIEGASMTMSTRAQLLVNAKIPVERVS